jgi:hypothetical protein
MIGTSLSGVTFISVLGGVAANHRSCCIPYRQG